MKPGTVYLVGAGPGDPGLITVKGLEALRRADVIVYDRLVNPRFLQEARPDAEKIYGGKSSSREDAESQRDLNRLLVEKARQGKLVVRLKGGDPFVFGRGGEEALALVEAGIPFEAVPGVTSGIAVPAYAGIPVTHRNISSSVAILTGHEDPTKAESSIRWNRLATGVDTLVLLMGMETLPNVVESLQAHGCSASTPVAVIQHGTEPRQRCVTGTLSTIVEQAREAGLGAPAVVVIGQVVALREKLAWFEHRPLLGKRVLVTRSREQASRLVELLLAGGALPVELPAIAVVPPDDWRPLDQALKSLSSFQWAIFTSVNTVKAFFQRLDALGVDARALAGVRLAAIGPATAQALQQRGLRPDYVPKTYLSAEIAKGLDGLGLSGQRVLLPRSDIAPKELVMALRAAGAQVEEVVAYHTVKASSQELAKAALETGVDIVTFTSSSTVRYLVELLEGDIAPLRQAVVACIGPTTAQTAREAGFQVHITAAEHTVSGLVNSLAEYFPQRGVQ